MSTIKAGDPVTRKQIRGVAVMGESRAREKMARDQRFGRSVPSVIRASLATGFLGASPTATPERAFRARDLARTMTSRLRQATKASPISRAAPAK